MRGLIVVLAVASALALSAVSADLGRQDRMASGPNQISNAAVAEQLAAGWNTMSWEAEGCEPAREAAGSLADLQELWVVASHVAERQEWRLFDPDAPDTLNTLHEICAGQIIVLYASHEVESQQPDTAPEQQPSASLGIGIRVEVANTGGDCLNTRVSPAGRIIRCLPAGYEGVIVDGPVYRDGYWWWHLGRQGWSAEPYLQAAPATAPSTPSVPSTLGSGTPAVVTFYNCEGQGGGYCGRTASGTQVGPGQAACDRSRLSSRFELAGQTYTCTDTGSAVNGNHVDIWFRTYEEGRAFLASLPRNPTVKWLPDGTSI